MRKHGLILVAIVAGCSSSASPYNPNPGDGGGPKTVVINEVFPNGPSAAEPDWVELKNLTGAAIDLQGYQVRDNLLADLFTLPAGTMIDAGGYLIIYCDDQDADGGIIGGVHTPWKLSAGKGDEVRLLNPSSVEIDAAIFGIDVPADRSWGRLPDGTGIFLRTSPTQGASNL